MILRRYITRQVALTTFLVLGFLVVLLLGGRMIRYFGIAAEGRLDVGLLFTIIGYNLPYFLELILPMSFFIGLMLVFGRLYVDHEMAVLNASGISRGKLARLITPLILVLFIAEAGLSLFAKPWGVRHSETIWHQQSLSSAFDLIRPQRFISSDDYHLYVGSMDKDKTELRDIILVQTTDDKDKAITPDKLDNKSQSKIKDKLTATYSDKTNSDNKDVIILAKRALQVQEASDDDKTQLDLYQGRRYEIGANNLAYNQVSFEKYRISIHKPPSDTVTETNVVTQPLSALWQVATKQPPVQQPNSSNNSPNEQQQTQQQVLSAQAELGYRFTLPWLMIIAPMLAVPLAQVQPRQGRWLRLLPAIMIFTSCAIIIMSLKDAVTKGSLSLWVYPSSIATFMLLALYLNWASRIHHRLRFRFKSHDTVPVSTSSPSNPVSQRTASQPAAHKPSQHSQSTTQQGDEKSADDSTDKADTDKADDFQGDA